MEVTLCDTKGCLELVEGEQVREFVKEGEGWVMRITLTEEVDMCAECSRKLFAKAASTAWNELKQKRKPKEENNKNGN